MQTEEQSTLPVVQETPGEVELPALSIEDVIKREESRFTTTPEIIKSFNKRYLKLKIKDENDKEGYEAVKLALADVNRNYTQIEKDKKLAKDVYLTVGRALDKKQKVLEEMLTPVRNHLKEQKEAIDKAVEREKERKENERRDKERARVQQLVKYCVFDGEFYSIGEALSIAATDLATISDELYGQFLDRVTEAHDAAELKRLEAEAETARLKKIDDDLKLQLEKEKTELQAEKDKLKATILRARTSVLKANGFGMLTGTTQFGKFYPAVEGIDGIVGHVIEVEFVETADDDTFYTRLETATSEMEAAQEAKIKQGEVKKRTIKRIKQLEDMEMTFNYTTAAWRYVTPSGAVSVSKDDLCNMDDLDYVAVMEQLGVDIANLQEAETLRLQSVQAKAKTEAMNEAERILNEKKAKRAKALAELPAAEQIEEYLREVMGVNIPEITGVLEPYFRNFNQQLHAIVNTLSNVVTNVKNAAADNGTEIKPEGTGSIR